jgi:AcrR family transcriptional regulator
MPRPRAFDEDNAVAAAKELFWDQGYLATSIGDLEEATGLSRSSLYLAFSSKQDLFAAALGLYLETFMDSLLDPLENEDVGLREIVNYFKTVATLFKEPEGQRGCLMINTIAESAGRDPVFTRHVERFLKRLRGAFANALKNSVRVGLMTTRQASGRAALLAGAAVGAWMTARVDRAAARALCLATASEVECWGRT